MSIDRLPIGLIAAGILAFLDSIITRAAGFLPFLLRGRVTEPSFAPLFAVVWLVILLVSPVGAFLLGYYGTTAFDLEARLGEVTAFVLVVGYICSAVGFLLGIWLAPSGVEVDGGSFLTQLVSSVIMAVNATVELTIAVVGGAALGRV